MALHLQGYALDHPVMAGRPRPGWSGFTIEDDAGRRVEACQSPVWDTALAVVGPGRRRRGSRRPGICGGPDDGWCARRSRVDRRLDRAAPELGPGGWAFEFAND